MVTRRTLVASAATVGVGLGVGLSAASAIADDRHQDGSRRKLIRGGRVLAAQGELTPGDVLIEDGTITEIGPRITGHGAQVIDAGGMIVAPGYINNHQHLWESLVRGISANANPTQHRDLVLDPLPPKLTVDDVYLGTLVGALDCLANGTTTVVNWDLGSLTLEHALAAVDALDDAGIRGFHSFSATRQTQNDPNSAPTEEEFRAVVERTSQSPLLGTHMGTRNPVNRDVLPRVISDFALARELGITISLHAGLATSIAVPHALNDAGLLGPDVMFVNGSAFTDVEFALIAATGGWIITAPEVEMQSGTPTPLSGILAAEIKPTVCTDSYAYIPSNMATQLRILLQSARERGIGGMGADLLTTEQVYQYATVNAAESLGIGDQVGSLAVGKAADIILVDTENGLNMVGVADVHTALVSAANPENIDTVIVGGRVVKRRGEVLGHNFRKLREKVLEAQERLLNS